MRIRTKNKRKVGNFFKKSTNIWAQPFGTPEYSKLTYGAKRFG